MADSAYQVFFKKRLAAKGVSSPAEMEKGARAKFMDQIDKDWTGEKTQDGDEGPSKAEAVTLTNSRAGSLLAQYRG